MKVKEQVKKCWEQRKREKSPYLVYKLRDAFITAGITTGEGKKLWNNTQQNSNKKK